MIVWSKFLHLVSRRARNGPELQRSLPESVTERCCTLGVHERHFDKIIWFIHRGLIVGSRNYYIPTRIVAHQEH